MSIVNKPAAGSKKTLGKGLTLERIYTTAGKHPYDEVTWALVSTLIEIIIDFFEGCYIFISRISRGWRV